MTMRDWILKRPWIWIVVFLVLMAVANGILVVVAARNAPVRISYSSSPLPSFDVC